MYTSIKAFLADWKIETTNTEKLFAHLTDASLDQKVYAEGRTLARLAWHLSLTTPEMLNRMGLHVQGPEEDAPVPHNVSAIQQALKQTSESSLEEVMKWNDEMLWEKVPMYGETWKRGVGLSVLIHHHIHHRGQMTVLMRQAGLKVPGLYGPSREEWEAMGMKAME